MATGAGNEQAVTYEILRILYTRARFSQLFLAVFSTAQVMELEDGFIF